MAQVVYYVVPHQGQWEIKIDGQHRGPYATQFAAIRMAVDAAHESGKRGDACQVLVQGRDDKFRTEWTYGKDPYPPVG